jgi:chromosomal replication initiation ATPase DnaA
MSDVWIQTLKALKPQMERETFGQWLAGTSGRVEGRVLTVAVKNGYARDWLDKRLRSLVERTLQDVSDQVSELVFVVKDQVVETSGTYHSEYNEIVQPDQVEVFSQYYRRKWRPLLGPLLSELVRELRQRCYHGKGDDKRQRDQCQTTHNDLARALGVSRNTLLRALGRDKSGKFKNELLHYFVKDVETVRKFDKRRQKWVNAGTRFVVYLDEPLTPDDEAKLSKSQNGT